MDDIAGDSSFRHSSAMVVGSGSISHDFDGALVISVFTDSSQRVSNLDKARRSSKYGRSGWFHLHLTKFSKKICSLAKKQVSIVRINGCPY